jgi:hypothetical protein
LVFFLPRCPDITELCIFFKTSFLITKGKLSQRYYWYEMREDLSIWISQCETCEENKPPHKAIRAPLGSMPVGAFLISKGTNNWV